MTEKEAIEIIKDSSIWDQLSKREKAEAIKYAIDLAKKNIKLQIQQLVEQNNNPAY